MKGAISHRRLLEKHALLQEELDAERKLRELLSQENENLKKGIRSLEVRNEVCHEEIEKLRIQQAGAAR